MTLTRILPSLRRSIPDPLDLDAWPELSHATTTDVFVSGVSLLRVADLCGTPSVHTAAAVIPCSGGRPSSTERASVIVARVTSVMPAADGALRVSLDARLAGLQLEFAQTRLIGRASTAKVAQIHLAGAGMRAGAGEEHTVSGTVTLPADIVVGDLLAIPCRRALAMLEVNPLPLEDGGGRTEIGHCAPEFTSAPSVALSELWLTRLG
ncbi:hypothetical protein [Leifsonia sp. A12D58]|uniref:hypothetical protein n=1 Tax=Leifsonia sp. A12D58 TaxID=3397674 RepID=UPI0039DF6CEF